MADNVSVTQGYGTTMATDEIGGVHYPRTKIVFGQDGSQEDVSAQSPLPVDIGSAAQDLATEETLSDLNSKAATEQTLAEIAGRAQLLATQATLSSADAKLATVNSNLVAISSKFDLLATQTTLASIDSKVATQTTLASIDSKVATQTTLASIDSKVATQTTLASIDSKVATQTTLASIDSKVATQTTLASIDSKVATEAALIEVRDLLSGQRPTIARQLAAGASSASTALTSTIRRISIYADGASIRYSVGTGSQTASAASHFIAQGERLTIAVPTNAQIAVIRASTTDGILELTELS